VHSALLLSLTVSFTWLSLPVSFSISLLLAC
jgi:hypothetical protein